MIEICSMNGIELVDIEVGGVDPHDWPEMSDAYVMKARWKGGDWLSQGEIDHINDKFPEIAMHYAQLEVVEE